MSTDYDVRCKTCGDSHGFNDANHQHDLMRALIQHREAIVALVPLMASTDVELRVNHYGRINPHWFAEHAGHELAVFDEYGREFGACREQYECDFCKARHLCKLPIGHIGMHGEATP